MADTDNPNDIKGLRDHIRMVNTAGATPETGPFRSNLRGLAQWLCLVSSLLIPCSEKVEGIEGELLTEGIEGICC